MNTFISRFSAVFAYSLSVLLVVTLCVSLSSSLFNPQADANVGIGKVLVRKAVDVSGGHIPSDLGLISLNLKTDLKNIFHWNVKQLFVFLVAEYATTKHSVNQVVLWDNIIRRDDPGVLNLEEKSPKYYFWDDGFGLRGNKQVNLSLVYEMMPNAGPIRMGRAPESMQFSFPVEYFSPSAS